MTGLILSRAPAVPAHSPTRVPGTAVECRESASLLLGAEMNEGYRSRAWRQLRDKGFRPPPDVPREQVTFFTSPAFPQLESAWVWVSADEQWVIAGDLAQNRYGVIGALAFKCGEPTPKWWYGDAELPPAEAICEPLDDYTAWASMGNHELWAEAAPLRGDEQFLRRALVPDSQPSHSWKTAPLRFHPRVSHRDAGLLATPDKFSPALLAKVTNRYGALVALQVHLFNPATLEPTGTGLTAPSEHLTGANVKLASRCRLGSRRLCLATRLEDALYATAALGRTQLLLSADQLRYYPLGGRPDPITVMLPPQASPEVLEAVEWLCAVARQTSRVVHTAHIE